MQTSAEPLLTIAELSDWLNVSRAQVYKLMDAGLPYYSLGPRRFSQEAVLDWLESRRAAMPG